MRRPCLFMAATASSLVLLAACSSPPALSTAPPRPASAPASAVAPAPAPPPETAPVEAPKPPSVLDAFEAGVASLAAESGVTLQRLAEGGLLLRAAGDGAFAPSSTTLTPRFASFVKQLAARLVQAQSLNIQITGHTDATGNVQRNDKLSEARARSAARLLTQHGVAEFRVTASGKGKHEPIASNDTAAGRASNRRVDIVITEGR